MHQPLPHYRHPLNLYPVSVLQEALRPHGLQLLETPSVVEAALRDHSTASGFVFNLHQHWYPMRQVMTEEGLKWSKFWALGEGRRRQAVEWA